VKNHGFQGVAMWGGIVYTLLIGFLALQIRVSPAAEPAGENTKTSDLV
jgi:hypothetical protein